MHAESACLIENEKRMHKDVVVKVSTRATHSTRLGKTQYNVHERVKHQSASV